MQFPRRHLYDPRTHALREILQAAPLTPRTSSATQEIPTASLARQIAFSYRASDGMRLRGFLTVPSGADVARLPLIANVHGGPWNHVRAGYHNLTQLLANRGYVVFEPNFRGSTGYGRDYLLAARGDFGNGRVQQDIADGVEDLLALGIGDPQRVGIIGASFGGYSTLLGVTFRPDLFRVGVAVVPPTDFAANLRWVARSSESLELANHVPFTTTLRLLSLDLDDSVAMRRLQSRSPLANAARVQRPLLLIASGADRRVPISNVVEYAARLRLLGKDVSLLVDADATHSNSDPVAREAYLYLLESMLARHLGGNPAAAPDPELRRYLDRNLRIRGAGLSGL
jgi:dipeptidyl aminopeptidase/acylaminoacyl peptidase